RLKIGTRCARRRIDERCFRCDVESDLGEPYLLAAAVENGAAPDVDGGRAPETKPALLAGLDVERDQQAVARGGELGPADCDVEAAGLVRRKRPASKPGPHQPI